MFYHIEGTVSEVAPNFVVIDCGGVGYGLNITVNTLSQIHTGERTKLYVAESITENSFDLFGFSTKSEKKCFDMLISVSGIGPKAAISILSYNTPEALAAAVINNNDKALTVAPGIGKKTALRVILELKDKLGKDLSDTVSIPQFSTSSADKSKANDAYTALNVLGYNNSEIAKALSGVDISQMSTEQIIKTALKNFD